MDHLLQIQPVAALLTHPGEELLRWCGFQARESRYEADGEGDFFGSRHDELQAHAMRHLAKMETVAAGMVGGWPSPSAPEIGISV